METAWLEQVSVAGGGWPWGGGPRGLIAGEGSFAGHGECFQVHSETEANHWRVLGGDERRPHLPFRGHVSRRQGRTLRGALEARAMAW